MEDRKSKKLNSASTKRIIPRGKWVLVRPLAASNRETEHGLILPANEEQEQKAQGIVEAVGDEIKGIKVGDEVIFGMFAGEPIKSREGGKDIERKLLLEEDIVAFIK